MTRTIILHKRDISLNRNKLNNILEARQLTHMSLYEKVVNKYGVDISYKGFMNLVSNRSTWKLLYAVAITDILDVTIDELFDIVEIDIKSKIREKERWKEKYEKRR